MRIPYVQYTVCNLQHINIVVFLGFKKQKEIQTMVMLKRKCKKWNDILDWGSSAETYFTDSIFLKQ